MQTLTASYDPRVFDVTSLAEARQIILTEEAYGFNTDTRWEKETPYLARLITAELGLKPSSLVLDYGCGIGRLSKAIMDESGCSVVGVDISLNMRMLALRYVASNRFSAISVEMLEQLVSERGVLFDAALSVWVLQHCAQVDQDINRLRESLRTGGRLFVVNENRRCIPTDKGWVDDGKSVAGLLAGRFHPTSTGKLPPAVASVDCAERTFWGSYSA